MATTSSLVKPATSASKFAWKSINLNKQKVDKSYNPLPGLVQISGENVDLLVNEGLFSVGVHFRRIKPTLNVLVRRLEFTYLKILNLLKISIFAKSNLKKYF